MSHKKSRKKVMRWPFQILAILIAIKLFFHCWRFVFDRTNINISPFFDKRTKCYGPFLWIGFNCLTTLKKLRRDNLLLTNH